MRGKSLSLEAGSRSVVVRGWGRMWSDCSTAQHFFWGDENVVRLFQWVHNWEQTKNQSAHMKWGIIWYGM